MKKGISLVLVLVLCLSLYACGKSKAVQEVETAISAIGEVGVDSREAIETAEGLYSALPDKDKEQVENYSLLVEAREEYEKAYVFELSKEAYENIKTAYELVSNFGSDYYRVRFLSVWKSDEVKNKGVSFLAEDLHYISEDELREGIRLEIEEQHEKGVDWLTEKHLTDMDYLLSELSYNSSLAVCLYATRNAYGLSGKTAEIGDALNSAKEQMKELSEKYSDYTHYPNLKDFFSATSSYYETCFLSGNSLEQYKQLFTDYEKIGKEYISDLDFIFGE